MAMYWAVQSPIPGSFLSALVVGTSGSGPGFEIDLSTGHGLREGPDGRDAGRDDPQRPQLGLLGGRQSCRRGTQSVQAGIWRLDRLAKTVGQPAGERGRGPNRDALAQDRGTAISKPSNAPGTRKPGHRLTTLAIRTSAAS